MGSKIRSACIATVVVLLMSTGVAASTAGNFESEFVSRINAERSSRGLRSLSVRSDLVAVARRHSGRMASQDRIYHNPSLYDEVGNWKTLAENVAVGPNVSRIHTELMNSSGHRANILHGSITEVGVGVVVARGKLWVTQVFREPWKSSAGGGSSGGGSSGGSVSSPSTSYSAPAAVAVAKPKPKPIPDKRSRTVRILVRMLTVV